MKLKYYLRGLGIGILVSTVILTISFSRKGSAMSDDEVIARAKELGMVTAEQSGKNTIPKSTEEILPTEMDTEIDTTKTDTTKSETEKTVPEKTPSNSEKESAKSETGAGTNESGKDSKPIDQADNVNQNVPQTTQPKEFHVEPGESSNVVADKLYVAGLVDDAKAFNNFLVNKKYDSKLRTGTYQIQPGTSYEDLGKKLMGK